MHAEERLPWLSIQFLGGSTMLSMADTQYEILNEDGSRYQDAISVPVQFKYFGNGVDAEIPIKKEVNFVHGVGSLILEDDTFHDKGQASGFAYQICDDRIAECKSMVFIKEEPSVVEYRIYDPTKKLKISPEEWYRNQKQVSPAAEVNTSPADQDTCKAISDITYHPDGAVVPWSEIQAYLERAKKDAAGETEQQLLKKGYYFPYSAITKGGDPDQLLSIKIIDLSGNPVEKDILFDILQPTKGISIKNNGNGQYMLQESEEDFKQEFAEARYFTFSMQAKMPGVLPVAQAMCGAGIDYPACQKLYREANIAALQSATNGIPIKEITGRQEACGGTFAIPAAINNIATPATVSTDIRVIASNIAFAIPFLLLFGFASSLFNATLKNRRHILYRHLARVPFLGHILTMQEDQKIAYFKKHRTAKILSLIFAIVLYGFITSFLSQQEKLFSAHHWQFIAITILAAAVLGLFPELCKLPWLRRTRIDNALTLYPLGLVFTLICVGISYIFGVDPALLFGVPVIMLLSYKTSGKAQKAVFIIEAGAGAATLLLGVVFWGISPLFNEYPAVYTFLLTAFLMIVESAFFELLPIEPLPGYELWEKNKLLWLGMALPVGFIFFHTITSPHTTLDQFTQSSTLLTTFLVLIVYSLCALIFWLIWGRNRQSKRS